MPSGKIVSFLFGEISPGLRFQTNLASFTTGLSKLLNKTVKKSGGAMNRPGFQFVKQSSLTLANNPKGSVRLIGTTIAFEGDETVEEDITILIPSEANEAPDVLSSNFNFLEAVPTERDLTNLKVTQLGSKIIISNGIEYWVYTWNETLFQEGSLNPTLLSGPLLFGSPSGSLTGSVTTVGSPQRRPVTYKIYQVLKTGEEVFYDDFDVIAPIGSSQPLEPVNIASGSVYNTVNWDLYNGSEVKHYNVYRANKEVNTANTVGPWGLVGRIPAPEGAGPQVTVAFNDYITVPDVTNPPPDQDYLYGDDGTRTLKPARLIGHYQQRRIVIPSPEYSDLKEGSIVASRIGAPDQLDTQVIFNTIGAFDFTTRIGVKNRIVAMMELERLIILTTESVTVIRGGEEGLLTPSTINPQTISYSGCSDKVTPVSSGRYGFFMSRSEDKLMRISFTIDGNIQIDEVSIVSEHLLEGSRVKEMVLTRNVEEILYLLKKDGTLISITLHAEGVTGWARHETDGFIESICSQTVNRQSPSTDDEEVETYEALYISVIRDNVRYIERLAYREDENDSQFIYSDSSCQFGNRLKLDQANSRYRQTVELDSSAEQLDNHTCEEASPRRKAHYIGTPSYTSGSGATTLYAENEGVIGNTISLTGDGSKTTSLLANEWNILNPTNKVFAFLGGANVLANLETVTLSQGVGSPQQDLTASATIGSGVDINNDSLWDENQDLEVINSGAGFKAAGELVVLDFFYEEDGKVRSIRWKQTQYVNPTTGIGRFEGTVPAQLRDVPSQGLTPAEETLIQTRWIRAKRYVEGLTHLANKEVSVIADGEVISSPNNDYYDTLTVDGSGVLDLGDYFSYGCVGISYTTYLETLDLDTAGNRTLTDSRKLINRAGVAFEETRGGHVGQTNAEGEELERIEARIDEPLEDPVDNINEHLNINFPAQWEKTGRVLVQQKDPLPMTVLAVYPKGIAGD